MPKRALGKIVRRLPISVGVAVGGYLVWVWFFADLQRQDKYIQTAVSFIVFYSILVIWAFLLAPTTWKRKICLGLALLLPVVFLGTTTRIRGVTGDLVPILEWRWKGCAPGSSENPISAPSPATATNLVALAQDYPQFLGPNRDGIVGLSLATNWGAEPPRQIWRKKIGPAWSGFVVSGQLAITQEQEGENELVTASDLLTGNRVWAHSYPAKYATTIAGEGPRATPTIVSNRVYAFGGTGILNCLDLASGKVLWTRDVLNEHGGSLPDWGMASSPLVVGDLVVVSGSGSKSLVAYGAETGEPRWATEGPRAGYSSPTTLELLGERILVNFNGRSIGGYEISTGKELWTHPWPLAQPNVTLPLAASSNLVFASTGYGRGSELLRLSTNETGAWSVEQVYKSNRLKSKFSNIFLIDGFVYGMDDGIMACVDVRDGSQKWKDGRFGHCQMILAGGRLIFVTEGGDLKIIGPSPDGLRELASMKVFSDKTWNPPTLAGAYFLTRNDIEAACFLLPLEQTKGIAKPE